jgi:thiamine-monophosphate kinase
MGGKPTYTFISLALRPDMDVEWVDSLYEGMQACAQEYGSAIAGGDTNSVPGEIAISVTQLGEAETVAHRAGARAGDRLVVTGHLGDSRGGLELLLRFGREESRLTAVHLTPTPRVAEARAAVGTGAVRAMMDLSDGLGADLPKLCKASGVGALVYADELPISDDLRAAAERLGTDPVELAAGGGEDFELLMAVGPEDVDAVIAAVESVGTRATEIGEVTDSEVEIVYPDGTRKPVGGGWEHFA